MHIVDWQSSSDHPSLRTAAPGPAGIEWAHWRLDSKAPPARRSTAKGPPLATEGGAVVLTGCHDLQAGSGSWHSRGIRQTPGESKPVAVYLPPNIEFVAANGDGEILVVTAPQTPAPEPASIPEPAPKPLLPMAGSNKAYNPATGTWEPIESFPDSPEAVPPRRMPTSERDGVTWTEIFPVAFKAADLCLAECTLPAGNWSLPDFGDASGARSSDCGIYLRPLQVGGDVAIQSGDEEFGWTAHSERPDLVVHCAHGEQPKIITGGPTYALLAGFGKPGASARG